MVKRHKETGRESARENPPPPKHTHTMMRTAGMSGPGPGPRAESGLKAKVLLPPTLMMMMMTGAGGQLTESTSRSFLDFPPNKKRDRCSRREQLIPTARDLKLKELPETHTGYCGGLRQSSTYNNNTRTWNEPLQEIHCFD